MTDSLIFSNARKLLDLIISTPKVVTVKEFILLHQQFFRDIPEISLLAPEDQNNSSESAYIFLIGSYIHYHLFGKPVTWLERRRFAEFLIAEEMKILFQKTLAVSVSERFSSLYELKKYLEILEDMVYE